MVINQHKICNGMGKTGALLHIEKNATNCCYCTRHRLIRHIDWQPFYLALGSKGHFGWGLGNNAIFITSIEQSADDTGSKRLPVWTPTKLLCQFSRLCSTIGVSECKTNTVQVPASVESFRPKYCPSRVKRVGGTICILAATTFCHRIWKAVDFVAPISAILALSLARW